MTLYLSMAVLLLAAVFWLTRPLWACPPAPTLARRAANVLAHQTRLAELQADVAAGVLPSQEVEALRQELDARLLADATTVDVPSRTAPRQLVGVAALALLIAGFGAAWYWQAGSWRTAQQITAGPTDTPMPSDGEIEGMVARLAERLASNPDDAEGWAMLGRSYFVMGRHADAAKAYGEANTRSASQNADWLVSEGEALALARDRDLVGRPAQLFEAALALEPGYGKALWYGSLADAQSGNNPRAVERLQRLLTQELPEELRSVVTARLDQLRELSGSAVSAAASVSSQPTASGGAQLSVQVTLAPALLSKLPASATLFVFAKAAQGPPMPLAVQRLPGARLPLTITLDDSMGMTPAMKLSQFDRYVVTARYSASGSAPAMSGDLEGSAEATRGSSAPVVIEINRVVP